MKKLLIIALLLTSTSAIAQKPVNLNLKLTKQEKRVWQTIALQSALFITSDYFLNKGNRKAFNITGAAFIGVTVTTSIYIFKGKKHKNSW